MNKFNDTHTLNEIIISILNHPNSVKYFKLLWSIYLKEDTNINDNKLIAYMDHHRNDTQNISMYPWNHPILNIIYHKNHVINDYLLHQYPQFYPKLLIKYLKLYNQSRIYRKMSK